MRAGPRGLPEKAMYGAEPASEGGVSAEGPTGGAGVSAQNARTGLKNKRWGGIECGCIDANSILVLYTAGFKSNQMGARHHVARARPTVSETQLGQSGTFTLGEAGCSPAPAVLGTRPASPAGA
jgi:hypothetical protein